MPEHEQDTAPQQPEFLFDAFISYRHAALDSAVAGSLQRSLEHYRVPREFQTKCGKQSLKRIFRDEEELGAASDLFGEIEQNLKRSEFLLVICTPRILESKWCMREIDTFIRYRGRENILAVLVEGEPDTAFPPALLAEGEPLAADVRGRSKAQVLHNLRQRMPRLAAPLLHCSYDELYQRHRVYKMRRLAAAAGAVAALSLGFGAVTVSQNRQITENYEGKLENQSQYLARLSGDLLAQGDREAALLVAREALPGPGEEDRPYVAEARIALEDALYVYNMDARYQLRPMKILEHKGILEDCFDHDPEEGVLLTLDGRAWLWDEDTLGLIACWDDGTAYTDARLGGGGRLFLLWEQGIRCVDYRAGKLLWEWTLPACPSSYCSSLGSLVWDYCAETGTILCMDSTPISHPMPGDAQTRQITDHHGIHLIDAQIGESRVWMPPELYAPLCEENSPTRIVRSAKFSPDGSQIAIAWLERADIGQEMGVCFRVLPAGGDGCPVREDLAGMNTVGSIAWLPDGAPMLISAATPDKSGILSFPARWQARCWEPDSGQLRFAYEDQSLPTTGRVRIQTADVTPLQGEETAELVSVLYDNVAVNLDRRTGACYSRMEDRKSFALSHIWEPGGLQLLITENGDVSVTQALEDCSWSSVVTAYQYHLDFDLIDRVEWVGERAYLFTSTAVYCYNGIVDEGYAMVGKAIQDYSYNSAHTRLGVLDYDDTFSVYDTSDTGEFSLLWREACADPRYYGRTAALLDERYAVWVDPALKGVRFRSIPGGDADGSDADSDEGPEESPEQTGESTVFIPLQLTETDAYAITPGGPGRAILSSRSGSPFFSAGGESSSEQAESAVCWVLDAKEQSALWQASWQQLTDALPIPERERPEQYLLHIAGARITASGRYLVLGCRLTSGFFDAEDFEETILLAWDLEEGCWHPLPESLCRHLTDQLNLNTLFDQDGWVAPAGDVVLLYQGEAGILVADVGTGEELCRLPVDGIASQEISFTPDGDHIIFQDGSRRLRVCNWRTGEVTQAGITPESGAMQFAFHEDGALMEAVIEVEAFLTDTTSIYRQAGPGEYKKETSIDRCSGCDGHTVIINDDNNTRFYHYYSLEDLLAKTERILGGRTLTEVERKNYLIE